MTEQTMQALDAALQLTGAALAKPKQKPKPDPFSRPTIYDAEDPDTIHAVDRQLGGYVAEVAYDNLLIAYEELQTENAELKDCVTLLTKNSTALANQVQNLKETLRGIAVMDDTEASRMRQWALDSLGGHLEALPVTLKRQQDELNSLTTEIKRLEAENHRRIHPGAANESASEHPYRLVIMGETHEDMVRNLQRQALLTMRAEL